MLEIVIYGLAGIGVLACVVVGFLLWDLLASPSKSFTFDEPRRKQRHGEIMGQAGAKIDAGDLIRLNEFGKWVPLESREASK